MIKLFQTRPDFHVAVIESILGLTWFVSFHCLFLEIVSLKFGRGFSLARSQLRDIATKLVSTWFAITTCFAGWLVFRQCDTDLIREQKSLVHHYVFFALPYFIYDIFAMYLVYRESSRERNLENSPLLFLREKFLLVVHHLMISTVGGPIFVFLRGGLGDCLLSLAFMMEISTPFVSLRVILHHLGMKTSKWYILNGLAMVLSFLFGRILLIPYMYLAYANQLGVSTWQVLNIRVPKFCTVCMIVVYLPQIYWFGLMIKGSWRALGLSRVSIKKN
ncbi:TLC domain-containing protein 3A-like [Tigriopus californicus]|nr:TLC domain-containing protein 3A-like [Tigriopus californicus]